MTILCGYHWLLFAILRILLLLLIVFNLFQAGIFVPKYAALPQSVRLISVKVNGACTDISTFNQSFKWKKYELQKRNIEICITVLPLACLANHKHKHWKTEYSKTKKKAIYSLCMQDTVYRYLEKENRKRLKSSGWIRIIFICELPIIS